MTVPNNRQLKKEYSENLSRELDGEVLYNALAKNEKNPKLSELYSRIAKTEGRHAEIWRSKLEALGVKDLKVKPSWRTRTLVRLAEMFGVNFVLPSVRSLEEADRKAYAQQIKNAPEAAAVSRDENSHASVLSEIAGNTHGGIEGGILAKFEGRHRAMGGNALRAAVLGANDGLVSNLSLVMGVVGAVASNTTVLISGIAGLIAGASSMALGEWLSVKSSRELFEHEIGVERREIEEAPRRRRKNSRSSISRRVFPSRMR